MFVILAGVERGDAAGCADTPVGPIGACTRGEPDGGLSRLVLPDRSPRTDLRTSASAPTRLRGPPGSDVARCRPGRACPRVPAGDGCDGGRPADDGPFRHRLPGTRIDGVGVPVPALDCPWRTGGNLHGVRLMRWRPTVACRHGQSGPRDHLTGPIHAAPPHPAETDVREVLRHRVEHVGSGILTGFASRYSTGRPRPWGGRGDDIGLGLGGPQSSTVSAGVERPGLTECGRYGFGVVRRD